ncbi:MAG: helix-turn-helix domain-containing protein [Halodesulfurarchaeum sp.]|nr:helix-turn-helix domain-containing protein [Halodesulfurarchaeum sp.]
MVEALNRHLERDLECQSLLECLYDLNDLDRQCFRVLADAEAPRTVDELATTVDRERSTVYRSVQRLLQLGLVQKDQVNYDRGGYYHVYRITDPDEIADEMQTKVNDWYAQIGYLVARFREKYGEGSDSPESPPPVT